MSKWLRIAAYGLLCCENLLCQRVTQATLARCRDGTLDQRWTRIWERSSRSGRSGGLNGGCKWGANINCGRPTTRQQRDGQKDVQLEYQVLAVLLVDGDHSALGGAFLACLLDADVSDVREVAQQLQLLCTKSTSPSGKKTTKKY